MINKMERADDMLRFVENRNFFDRKGSVDIIFINAKYLLKTTAMLLTTVCW